MTRYKGMFEGTRNEAIEPQPSYRAALDAARSEAWRSHCAIVIVDADSGAPEMVVNPDGSTRAPGAGPR